MKRVLVAIMMMMFLWILYGCANPSNDSVTARFLTKFYSVNDLSQVKESIDNLENSDDFDNSVIEYHKSISEFMTAGCLESVIANRNLLQVHKMAIDSNVTFSPLDIVLDASGGTVEFSLIIKVTEQVSKNEKEIVQKGQVSISDDGKIDRIFFYNLGDLKG